jgi:hypothetical protein
MKMPDIFDILGKKQRYFEKWFLEQERNQELKQLLQVNSLNKVFNVHFYSKRNLQ